ncbi:copper amine oxidase N-terminal domain-containing protein [Paenibacillus selenitireducens]|uniref:copper amine oxidase N-terminal domain-containing protein n=1 Tax=Paenibacillus selenitireducens TaxID=1324314 RepID=UPI001301FDD0|nr:copper amine oxidase N-terminal domain-containing protein [Paenibacillus selenitireducens]
MKARWIATALFAALLAVPAVAQAGGTAYYRFSWDQGGESSGSAVVKNGTTYISASVMESAGMSITWDKAHQRAEMIGYGKKAAVRIGSKTGVIDGRLVDVGAAPYENKNELFVPARFIVQTLEGNSLTWDAEHQLISAAGLHTYPGASQTYAGMTYSVVKNTGELFVTDKNGIQTKIANLGSELYDGVTFDFRKTPGGLLFLTIGDNYGEPHINNHLFYLILKDGSVIRQSDVKYWQRYEQNVTQFGNELLLTDGKTLRFIEDGTGVVKSTLDLVKFGGEDDNYFIEGGDDDFLLIRANGSGLLKLVERSSQQTVILYDKLLGAADIQYAESNDAPYRGDYLKYAKREENILYFRNNSPIAKDTNLYSYTLHIKVEEKGPDLSPSGN